MTNEEKRQEVYYRFKAELTPDKSGKGYICPICGSGSGPDGTGITENKRSPWHYTCWGGQCFKNADAFEILALQAGIAPNGSEAMRYAYERYGITSDSKPSVAQVKQDAQEVHTAPIEQDFTAYYGQAAANITSDAAVKYLNLRGISIATAQKLGLGYDAAWRSPKALREGKNPPASPRLIIPTSAHSYAARATTDTEKLRYIKEGGVELFNVQAIYSGRPCFIVEGELDAVSIIEAGGAAAALGSISNVDKLLKACKQDKPAGVLLIALDNDDPGANASKTLCNGLHELGVSFDKVDVYNGLKDANEALCANRGAFTAAIAATEAKHMPGAKLITSFLQAVQSKRYEPIPTGLKTLDDIIGGGLLRQTLVMLGAAPGMGKSYFTQQICESMAAQGRNVLYFNLEMSAQQMLARSISRIAHERENAKMTAIDVLQGYKWTEYQRGVMERTAAYYAQTIAPHMAYNPGGGTAQLDDILAQMNAAAQRAAATGTDAPIAVIDYLHLLRGQPREDVQDVVKRAVDAFKRYAMENNTVVFVILAFNRSSNKDGKVTQESGRDSSGIEYAADLLLGLNYARIEKGETATSAMLDELRKEACNRQAMPYALKVLKNRLQGGCDTAYIDFIGRYGLFAEHSADGELPFYEHEKKPRRL